MHADKDLECAGSLLQQSKWSKRREGSRDTDISVLLSALCSVSAQCWGRAKPRWEESPPKGSSHKYDCVCVCLWAIEEATALLQHSSSWCTPTHTFVLLSHAIPYLQKAYRHAHGNVFKIKLFPVHLAFLPFVHKKEMLGHCTHSFWKMFLQPGNRRFDPWYQSVSSPDWSWWLC